jgi:hypothetical protein
MEAQLSSSALCGYSRATPACVYRKSYVVNINCAIWPLPFTSSKLISVTQAKHQQDIMNISVPKMYSAEINFRYTNGTETAQFVPFSLQRLAFSLSGIPLTSAGSEIPTISVKIQTVPRYSLSTARYSLKNICNFLKYSTYQLKLVQTVPKIWALSGTVWTSLTSHFPGPLFMSQFNASPRILASSF